MGIYSSTCRDTNTVKHTNKCTVTTALYWCKIDQLVETLKKLQRSKLTLNDQIDAQTLAHILPFSLSVGRTLLQPITDQGFVDWKSCLGGLAFCVSGRVEDRLHFLLTLYGYQSGSVTRYELRQILLNVLLITEKIYKCELGAFDVKRDVFLNVDVIVDDILNDLFNYQEISCAITLSDIQKWATHSPTLSRAMFRRDSQMKKFLRKTFKTVQNTGTSHDVTGAVAANQQSRYKWNEIIDQSGGRTPSSRCKHASCVYDGAIYMYGGRDGNIPHRDIWKFDLNLEKWSQLSCKGDRPMLLQEHTMVAYKGKLYVFGGDFSYGSSETPLWILDLDSLRWVKPSYGEVVTPSGMRGHTAVVCNNAMHVYGGYQDLKGSLSTLWTYDFEESMWHLAYSDTLQDDGPGARYGHSAVVHDQAMWVYGGMCDLQPRNDFWKWSFGMHQWTRIRYKQGPPELSGHTGVKVADGMVIYGGESSGALQGDIWKYTFGSQTWSKVHFHPPCPPPRTHHCAVAVPGFALTSSPADRCLSVPQVQGHKVKDVEMRPYTSPGQRPIEIRSRSQDRRSRSKERDVSPLISSGNHSNGIDNISSRLSDIAATSTQSLSDSESGSRSSQGHKFRNKVLPLYGDVDSLMPPHLYPDQPFHNVKCEKSASEDQKEEIFDNLKNNSQTTKTTHDDPPTKLEVTNKGYVCTSDETLSAGSQCQNDDVMDLSACNKMEREYSTISDFSSLSETAPLVKSDMKRSITDSEGTELRQSESGAQGFENPVFSYSCSLDSTCVDTTLEPIPVKRYRSDTGSTTCDDTLDDLNTSSAQFSMKRSRTLSSSADSLLSISHSSARLALQREVLPGAVRSGSLESLLQGMGGVQLKYINIDRDDDDHVTHRADHVTDHMVVEDIEDYDIEALCGSQSNRPGDSIGPHSDQSRTEFVNPFIQAQGEGNEIHFYNQGINMTVFNNYDNKNTEKPENSSKLSPVPKQVSNLKTSSKTGSLNGQGQNLRSGSRLLGHTVDLLRESSFMSGSSGYYSESQHEFSERNHPYRESFNSDVSQRDFSAFVTQPDRERISNRGRDMTMYMYIMGGKESKSQNVTIKPINMWKLQIY